MVKKLFALASVSALAGLVSAAGVSGCTTETVTQGGGGDAGSSDAKKDSKGTVDTDSGEEEDPPLCYKEDPVDATGIEYKAARVKAGSCTTNVDKVLEDLIAANKEATFDDLKAALAKDESQECADCVFAEDDGTWAPIVTKSGKVDNINLGGCLEVVSGNEDCGKGYTQWNACLESVCAKCEDDDAQACGQDAQSTACKEATEAFGTACGSSVNAYIKECFEPGKPSILGPIHKLCVTGGVPKDAGPDAN